MYCDLDHLYHQKPAFRVKYDEYMENGFNDDISQRIIALMRQIALDACLEGWMDAGGESPCLTAKGVRLDPRTMEQLIPEEKYLPVEE